MTSVLHIDLETRSTVDLRTAGVHAYARHPDTDIWCACTAVDNGPVQVWRPGDPVPDAILEAVQGAIPGRWTLCAHNAQFERVIWETILGPRYGWRVPALEQWRCTAAMASAMALPRALDGAAGALGLRQRKDKEGAGLMMRMARPRKVHADGRLDWWDVPERIARLIDYCTQDVLVERALHARLRRLCDTEQRVYRLDQVINDRGVALDLALIDAARDVTDTALARLNARLRAVTGGAVTTITRTADLTRWLNARGVDTDSVAKPAVRALLADDTLPADTRAALDIRQEAAKSSTAKLKAMQACVCPDGRARGLLLYHGAGTGRWAGRLVQPQNFPRGTVKDVADTIPTVLDRDPDTLEMLFAPPLDVISSLLRSCLIAAPGHDLIAADFSNIEGRVTAWLAGETWKVQAFRDFDAGTGRDIYLLGAERILALLGRPPAAPLTKDSPERQGYGKVPELALGFQGGVGAFQSMAALYNVQVTDEEADQIKIAWREAHPAIVALWRGLEDAAMKAVRRPGVIVRAAHGRIAFRVKGGFLWMVLPSGRPLAYAAPTIRAKVMPWVDRHGEPVIKDVVSFMGEDRTTRKWCRQYLYGGLSTENAVQAIARDLLAVAMLALETAGYRVVLTVHDEIVAEVPKGFGDLATFEDIMCRLPAWATGLPVAAEGWRGQRYRK